MTNHYIQVLSQIKSLSLSEKLKLLGELKELVNQPVEVEGEDETMPIEEIIQSQRAWDDYTSEKDKGISSQELKRQLLSELMVGWAMPTLRRVEVHQKYS
jgi:hypothetical protein